MNICIVTRIDYRNYGNRLQNYALMKLLENEGWHTVSGLQVSSREEWVQNSDSNLKKRLKRIVPFIAFEFKEKKKLINLEKKHKNDIRRVKFKEFTNKYIETLPRFIIRDDKQLYDVLSQYGFDYYLAGSDQVWNPYFGGRNYEFLTFAPKSKRLSFAASFGVDSIPDAQKDRFAVCLSAMKHISVRERKGIEIVYDLTGRTDAVLTLDPTLLLERQYWEDLTKECNINRPKHYIVTYFIGEEPDSVIRFSNIKKLPIIRLNNKKEPSLYDIGPIEFITLIHDADYVLTDSFHGLAFAIKFNKEFYIFKRKDNKYEDMFGRLLSLASILGFEDRIQDREEASLLEHIKKGKWEEVDEYLFEEKEKSMKRLKMAMRPGKKDED